MEIERKWMVKNWPPEELGLPLLYEQSMRQGYISVRPTVRIREEAMTGGNTEYVLCFKSGTGLVRKEIEMSIPKDKFLELEDLESGELATIDTGSSAVRRAYSLLAAERARQLQTAFRSMDVAQIDLQTGDDYAKKLVRFFRNRERRHR